MMGSCSDTRSRMGTRPLFSLAWLVFIMLAMSGGVAAAGKAKAFFVFGDSYADTGNQPKNGLCQQPPYGETYPGFPSGRCGNGAIQTDFLSDIIELRTPTPYVYVATQGIATGVNFAIAGSAITYALGVLPYGAEIDFLEQMVNAGIFTPEFLSESIFFVSNVGNDYSGNFTNSPELLNITGDLIEGQALGLQRLYALGARNIMVANLGALNCLPSQTVVNNYTSCPTATDPVIALYNGLLVKAVAQLNLLPGANIIILDENKAFNRLLHNPQHFGITDPLVPCCKPDNPSVNCGYKDANGNPLYTLCPDPSKHIYWDTQHPVQTAWQAIVELFGYSRGYVIGARNIKSWLGQIAARAVSPAPAPLGLVIGPGAEGQLDRLYNALLSKPEYAESSGLLQDMNLDQLLRPVPAQTVTVFIPDNTAYTLLDRFFLDNLYANDEVLSVIAYHVVEGFYDQAKLAGSPPLNLTTVSNLKLSVTPSPQGISVGTNMSMVIAPNLYVEPGTLVVHGISKLLLPPNLVSS